MSQFVRTSIIGLVVLAVAAVPASAQGKVGYVNTQAVLSQTPAMAAAQAEFNKRVEPYNAEAQKMDSTLKALVASFTNDTTDRAGKAQMIQDRQAQYEARMGAIEDTVQNFRQRLIGPLMEQLEKSLDEVRVEGGYAMIFDVAQGSVIVAADTALDVTPKVIAKMKNAVTPSAASPAGAGPVARPAGVTSRPKTPPQR